MNNEENKSKEIQGKNVLSFTKFCSGGFCPGVFGLEGFCRGVYVRGIFVLIPTENNRGGRLVYK